MHPAVLVLLANTAVLAVASVLLLYPVLRYAWNVAYTEELLLLSTSFVLIAGGYVVSMFFHLALVNNAINLAAAFFSFWAVWRLAMQFVESGSEEDAGSFELSTESVEEGFRDGG